MRIGVIGLGRIGAFHAATLAAVEAVDALVVADPRPGAVDAVLARHDIAKPADSAAEVLASGVDGVVIAASTNAHPELLRAAVGAGVPAFCEKPVAARIEQAVELQRMLAGSDVPVQIGYPRRFDPAFAAARSLVRSGALGRVHTVRSTTLDPAPPSPSYLAVSGGIFRDCSVHDFDAVRWVCGQEVVEVYAVGAVDPDAARELYVDNDDYSTVSTLLTMSKGTIGVVSNTRTNGRGYDVRLEVHGVLDGVAAGLDDGLPLRSTEPGATWPTGPAHTSFMDRLAEAFRRELATFTRVAAREIASPCTIDDALGAAWAAEAATLSARERRPVTLDEVRGAVR
jgi:myo-inositol 2-dehydrogenase/D-chiro-inositol 1-dehydrogenase